MYKQDTEATSTDGFLNNKLNEDMEKCKISRSQQNLRITEIEILWEITWEGTNNGMHYPPTVKELRNKPLRGGRNIAWTRMKEGVELKYAKPILFKLLLSNGLIVM